MMRKLLTGMMLLVAALFMAGTAMAASNITFAWDANSEEDLAGYKLYEATQAGGPYTEVEDIALGELTDPTNPQYTITKADVDGTFYWVITAYDDADPANESAFSNEVSGTIDDLGPGAPVNFQLLKIHKQ